MIASWLFLLLHTTLKATIRYVDLLPAETGSGWNGVNGGAYLGSLGKGKGYLKIQDAINAMNSGDTILLRGGTYHETHISLTANNSTRHGSEGAPNILKSYPGEWAIIDGQYQDPTNVRPSVIWGTGGSGISWWVFENLEITGGGDTINPTSKGGAIWFEYVKHCTFRNLYIHHYHGLQHDDGATGGIFLKNGQYCTIEFCHFKANGNLNGERNTCNAQLVIVTDYKYAKTVVLSYNADISNVIRYNLFDGDGGAADKYTSIGFVHKGFQRLTGYEYGETANPSDCLPNDASYREYGDKLHHNIFINMPNGMRLDQDYVQAYNNIIDLVLKPEFSEPSAILVRDEFASRKGPVYACAYNNLIKTEGSKTKAINFRLIGSGYDCAVKGASVDYFKGFAVNNIIENGSIGYDWAPICFEGNGFSNCQQGEPLKLSNFNVSRNLFYSCTQGPQVVRFADKTYDTATIKATVAADKVWKKDSPSPFIATSGAAKYKTSATYLMEGDITILNGGLGGSHPYMANVELPSYIGATHPWDDNWVDGVLSLSNTEIMRDLTSTDPAWVENTLSPLNIISPASSNETFTIYPNPTRGRITVDAIGKIIYRVEIRDIFGENAIEHKHLHYKYQS
jgi:hypothetical protein